MTRILENYPEAFEMLVRHLVFASRWSLPSKSLIEGGNGSCDYHMKIKTRQGLKAPSGHCFHLSYLFNWLI